MIEYSYSLHALMRIKKRELKSEWIEKTLNSPDEIVYLEGTQVVYFLAIRTYALDIKEILGISATNFQIGRLDGYVPSSKMQLRFIR